jgi:MoxR-like ATPase
MPVHSSIPEVTFTQAIEAILAAHDANIPVLLLGDPGVGKSALFRIVAERIDKILGILLGSTCDPTDVGGLPVKNGSGSVDRVPLKVIRDAADSPRILFLDEISCAPPAVQASLLRLMLERVAGDVELHPESWICAAANPPEQAPGGFELSAPLMGRVCVLHLKPTPEEVRAYFMHLGAEGSPLRLEAIDWAMTCGFIPSILEIEIPKAAVAGNIPWGAPRAWERAIRARVAAAARKADVGVIHSLTAGNVGDEQATAYAAVLKLRQFLPSIETVLADPANAKVPDDRQHQIAAVGLVPRVAVANTWAAWIYAQRLIPEIGAACAAHLEKCTDSPVSAPFAREGVQARVKLSGMARAA